MSNNTSSSEAAQDAERTNPSEYDLAPDIAARLKRNEQGLVPAIVQAESGEVLMMAWMDDHALAHSLMTRKGTYFSRSRDEYWVKGETSGNVQEVVGARLDCDGDTILLTVRQSGGACHTGDRTCFDADYLLHPQSKNPS